MDVVDDCVWDAAAVEEEDGEAAVDGLVTVIAVAVGVCPE